MSVPFERSANWNVSVIDFKVLKPIDDKAIKTALGRYEQAWHTRFIETFTSVSEDGRPHLFSVRSRTEGRLVFNYVKARSVADSLHAPDASVNELSAKLDRHGDLDGLARSILGNGVKTVVSRLLARTFINYTLYQDLRNLYVDYLDRHGTRAPKRFFEFLTNFGAVQGSAIHMCNAHAFLVALYAEGYILHPLGIWRALYPNSGDATSQKFMDGSFSPDLLPDFRADDFRQIYRHLEEKAYGSKQVRRFLHCLLLTTHLPLEKIDQSHILQAADAYLTNPGFLGKSEHTQIDTRRVINRALSLVSEIKKVPGRARVVTQYSSVMSVSKRSKDPKAKKRTEAFQKLCEMGLTEWVICFERYSDEAPVRNKTSLVGDLAPIADWLREHASDLSSPVKLQRHDIVRIADTKRSVTLVEYLYLRYGEDSSSPSQKFGQLRFFYQSYLSANKYPISMPLLKKDQPPGIGYSGKTDKLALPARIMEKMKEILISNDWEWSKKFDTDYVECLNSKSNRWEYLWCPARAAALYVLLWLPLRTIQVRLLDSGEFDQFIYDAEKKSFVLNPRGISERENGVFRQFSEKILRESQIRLGLYINTNKTKNLYSIKKKQGFEVKWSRPEITDTLMMVRDWQATYNPIREPTHVNDLSDQSLSCPENMRKFIPPYAFLFRDPASKRSVPHEPISHLRLQNLFIDLCDEAERRLRAEGEDITLINRREDRADGTRAPVGAVVTLHSLRVSGITNFAEFGVPLNILTEFLAGHSSILMNIWYQKFGFSTVSGIINKAMDQMAGTEGHKQLQAWCRDQNLLAEARKANTPESDEDETCLFELGRHVVAASYDAVRQVGSNPRSLHTIGIDGLCPMGGTACAFGGPRYSGRLSEVPGGAGNCPRCRFWVTGPAFIFGQIVMANVQLYRVQELGQRLTELQEQLDEIYVAGVPAEGKTNQIKAAIRMCELEVDNALHTWVRRHQFAERSVSMLPQDGNVSDGKSLLLTGDDNDALNQFRPDKKAVANEDADAERGDKPELVLVEGHQLRLMEFVTQACEIIPGIDGRTAPFKKARLLDAMMPKAGKSSFLLGLSQIDSVKTGNAMTNFFARYLDDDEVCELMAGDKRLEDFGLTNIMAGAITSARQAISASSLRVGG